MTIIDAHSHLWLKHDTWVDGKRILSLKNGRSIFMDEEVQMLPPFMIDGRNSAEVFLSNMDYAQVGGRRGGAGDHRRQPGRLSAGGAATLPRPLLLHGHGLERWTRRRPCQAPDCGALPFPVTACTSRCRRSCRYSS